MVVKIKLLVPHSIARPDRGVRALLKDPPLDSQAAVASTGQGGCIRPVETRHPSVTQAPAIQLDNYTLVSRGLLKWQAP